jgi:uncharacterized glyoxalase superfamily protein PhnB
MKVISSISVFDAKSAIQYYEDVFDAKLKGNIICIKDTPGIKELEEYGEKVAHAEIHFGESIFFITNQLPNHIQTIGRNVQFCINLYDKESFHQLFKKLVKTATIEREIQEEFWGDSSFSVKDPYDIVWHIFLIKGEDK